ncbi:26S proteasome non-ATPase regulatory subunit 7 [Populus alba x Populus x berolinensis]|nr:26S proteasome non-ATPase regulatory subunit 7 [Populus alba x Populus x berolinensis]
MGQQKTKNKINFTTCENKRFPSEQASSSRRRVVQFLGKKLRMDVIKTQQISAKPIEKVIVHPLVLLSIVDNYNRVAKDTRKRVVGVLLGSSFKGTVDVTNSYAVPFEEDDKDPSIWFLDHNYHESMFSMFKRINAKEHVVGWYSTGPKLRENDLKIHGLFNDYVPNPVLVIIDVQPEELGIPTKAYYAVEEVKENATQKSQKVFVHVPSEIAAHDVEEIGVEHLLRDVKDTTISTLATEVTGKLAALKGLDARLKEIRGYLDLVIEGKLPLNMRFFKCGHHHCPLEPFQMESSDVFNLLPNLNVADLIKAFAVKTNDMMLVIYLSSLIRSVIALHNLISNKMLNKEHEKAEDSKPIVCHLKKMIRTQESGFLTTIITTKEHVVGWYSTGPKLRENDLEIHGLFNNYVPNPVLVIIDVQPEELGIPTKAYYAVEEVKENATQKSRRCLCMCNQKLLPMKLRKLVTGKLAALKGLDARLKEIRGYLDLVIEEKLPLNHEILYHLQDVFNLLPNLNVADLIKAFAVKTNDMMLVIYLSSLIRSVIALHNLINNKMLNKEHEKAEDSKPVALPPVAGS